MKNLIQSLTIILIGLFGYYESLNYNLGTLHSPGPGFFPRLISISLIVVGILIFLKDGLRK